MSKAPSRTRQDRINAACARYRAEVEAYLTRGGPIPSVGRVTAGLSPDERQAVHDYAYVLFVQATGGGLPSLFQERGQPLPPLNANARAVLARIRAEAEEPEETVD